jgi:glyoxylate/hydroxypyruvate reductase A
MEQSVRVDRLYRAQRLRSNVGRYNAPMSLALVARLDNPEAWRRELAAALPGERLEIWPDVADRSAIDIALVAKPPPGALAEFPHLALIASLWAGVDGLLADPALPGGVPLTRLIDPQLTTAMVETVVLHVLSAHRLAPRYRRQQRRGEWLQHEQPAAAERTVAILGFGELGRACAAALRPFGFQLVGWTRTPRSEAAIALAAGDVGLRDVLSQADIVVSLLPATRATRGLLDAERLSWLPPGAALINVGRGAVVDDAALLAALDGGRIEAAILDVFAEEPLPAAHPYWTHERVWVYPHVAAETDPRSAARVVADTIRRFRAGLELPELVDRERGY